MSNSESPEARILDLQWELSKLQIGVKVMARAGHAPAIVLCELVKLDWRAVCKCGKPVEPSRQCYMTPTCYECLPPPPPLKVIPVKQ